MAVIPLATVTWWGDDSYWSHPILWRGEQFWRLEVQRGWVANSRFWRAGPTSTRQ